VPNEVGVLYESPKSDRRADGLRLERSVKIEKGGALSGVEGKCQGEARYGRAIYAWVFKVIWEECLEKEK
jgi:hypothetical protein